MASDATVAWRNCFQRWPDELQRRGVLVVSFGEQIPFDGFATSDDLLLVERRTPDTVGSRTVLIAYSEIQALKITEIAKLKSFQGLGFSAPPGRK
jgi:hypothetical protein